VLLVELQGFEEEGAAAVEEFEHNGDLSERIGHDWWWRWFVLNWDRIEDEEGDGDVDGKKT
jgi:hypothetical protein